MKLISDIVNELVDTEKSISSPFLKTKVLASRLGNQELLFWVNQELNGYFNNLEVPTYRKYICAIRGDYVNGNTQFHNQSILLSGLDEEFEKSLTSVNFSQSIATLENLVKNNKNGTIEMPLPAEVVEVIHNSIVQMGNPYFQLINAKIYTSINAITEILSVLRNRLLDFMLKIDSEFGNLTEIEELKTKKNEISQIMNQTIINTSGDGNIVNTGNNSTVKSTITINKGNKDALKSQLEKMGIAEVDSSKLLSVIDDEIPNGANHQFGVKVNSWIQKMIGKSLNGSWEVTIATAGTLLAEVIKKYYGI